MSSWQPPVTAAGVLRLCIEGYHETGADSSPSCDISENQLAHARQVAVREGLGDAIEFVCADTMKLEGIPDGGYDLVYTSNGVHVWLNDLETMKKTMSITFLEVAKLLKKSEFLIGLILVLVAMMTSKEIVEKNRKDWNSYSEKWSAFNHSEKILRPVLDDPAKAFHNDILQSPVEIHCGLVLKGPGGVIWLYDFQLLVKGAQIRQSGCLRLRPVRRRSDFLRHLRKPTGPRKAGGGSGRARWRHMAL